MSLKSKNNFVGKIIILIWIVLFMFSLCGLMVEASEPKPVVPENYEHLELRATTIQDVGNTKQVIMELWGYNINFTGFDVRFKFDKKSFELSDMDTNDTTDVETKFFKFETEFADKLDMMDMSVSDSPGENETIVHPVVTFTESSIDSETDHIKNADNGRTNGINRRQSFTRKIKFENASR